MASKSMSFTSFVLAELGMCFDLTDSTVRQLLADKISQAKKQTLNKATVRASFQGLRKTLGKDGDTKTWRYINLLIKSMYVLILYIKDAKSGSSSLCWQNESDLLTHYPEFADQNEEEINLLLKWRNTMAIALELIDAKNHKGELMAVVGHLCGHVCVTGGGQTASTSRRVLIYEREGHVVKKKTVNRKKRADADAPLLPSVVEGPEDDNTTPEGAMVTAEKHGSASTTDAKTAKRIKTVKTTKRKRVTVKKETHQYRNEDDDGEEEDGDSSYSKSGGISPVEGEGPPLVFKLRKVVNGAHEVLPGVQQKNFQPHPHSAIVPMETQHQHQRRTSSVSYIQDIIDDNKDEDSLHGDYDVGCGGDDDDTLADINMDLESWSDSMRLLHAPSAAAWGDNGGGGSRSNGRRHGHLANANANGPVHVGFETPAFDAAGSSARSSASMSVSGYASSVEGTSGSGATTTVMGRGEHSRELLGPPAAEAEAASAGGSFLSMTTQKPMPVPMPMPVAVTMQRTYSDPADYKDISFDDSDDEDCYRNEDGGRGGGGLHFHSSLLSEQVVTLLQPRNADAGDGSGTRAAKGEELGQKEQKECVDRSSHSALLEIDGLLDENFFASIPPDH